MQTRCPDSPKIRHDFITFRAPTRQSSLTTRYLRRKKGGLSKLYSPIIHAYTIHLHLLILHVIGRNSSFVHSVQERGWDVRNAPGTSSVKTETRLKQEKEREKLAQVLVIRNLWNKQSRKRQGWPLGPWLRRKGESHGRTQERWGTREV